MVAAAPAQGSPTWLHHHHHHHHRYSNGVWIMAAPEMTVNSCRTGYPVPPAGPRSFGVVLNVENPIMTRMMNACHSHIPISSGFRIQVALAVKSAHRPSEM
ncbi:GM25383 [Drosophila sechellia]|uniref:GM25383 n=1 Tax=Drosophila sechellia TaxID=7238 RepID=B4HG84_DROSE|nr:GM25383 [Drosophila sechellia]